MSILKDLKTPAFAAEGLPSTDANEWKVRLGGLAPSEIEISLEDIKSLPGSMVNCRLTSVSGWSVRADWEGVLWRDFINIYKPLPSASHVTFTSAGGYTTTVPLVELDHPRALLCWRADGEDLEPEYGWPLRMIVPNLWGYKSCKWIAGITFVDRMIPGFWESRGYSVSGEIEPGTTLDVNSKTRRRIKGGEVTEF